MSDKTKVVLISALNTFLATFIVAVSVALSSENIEIQWTIAFWLPLAAAAARAGVKAVIEQFVPVKLGGKK